MAEDLLPLLGFNNNEEDSDNESNDEEDSEEDDIAILNEDVTNPGPPPRATPRPIHITFDASLPSTHSYLGNDLEEVRGRTVHEDDAFLTLPIITLPNVVLFPGQTIPLHLFQAQTVAMMKNVIDSDKTFGIITRSYGEELTAVNYGTTAEIFSAKDESDERSGISIIRIKARGRQRFVIHERRQQVTGTMIAKVRILPETFLPDILSGARPRSQFKFCCCPSGQDEVVKTAVNRKGQVICSISMVNNRQVNRFTGAYCTWWPPWVYKMYDAELLMTQIKKEFLSWNETLQKDIMPVDATEFSFWVAQNLPLNDQMRLHLLSIDTAVQRLRCELGIMQRCTVLCCNVCGRQIADKKDIFNLSEEGPLAAYVNPGGYVHETLTIYKAKGLRSVGRPSTENSWFPGYAWTIVQCQDCAQHMGWKFTVAKKKLSPEKFWGLCRSSLLPAISSSEEIGADEWTPVT